MTMLPCRHDDGEHLEAEDEIDDAMAGAEAGMRLAERISDKVPSSATRTEQAG